MPLAHVEASGASPLEHEIVRWVRHNKKALSKKVALKITYMRSRKEAEIIGDDGHFRTIIARLVEYSILKLHKHVRVFFESGVKVPVVTLWLGGGVMDPLDSLSPFLL